MHPPRVAIVAPADWYFWSHRLPIARAARAAGCEVLVIAGAERGYGPRIEAEGFRFLPLPIARASTHPAAEFKTLAYLFRVYRRERPALVHHVGVKSVIYGSIAARLAGVPAIINAIAGQGYTSNASGLRRRAVRAAIWSAYRLAFGAPRTRGIFQNPEDLRAFVDARVVESAHAALIRGAGVDLSEFRESPEPTGPPVVVFASRLLWSKGLGDLVDAQRILQARGLALRMVVVGIPDTHNREAIPEATLRGWHDQGLIEWWGLRDDMPAVLSAANIVALPTTYGEGVPKVLIEAAAAGRVIVTTDAPGCREVVRNGVNGLLVPKGDVQALADALATLATDPATRRRMGAAGRAIAENEFDANDVADKTLALYRELLGLQWPTSEPRVPLGANPLPRPAAPALKTQ